jgi:hypothetical protein
VKEMKEFAFDVLNTIGLPPFVDGNPCLPVNPEHLHFASLNKICLLYLETIAKEGKLANNSFQLANLRKKHTEIRNLAVFLRDLFNDDDISYSIIKTLRPFPYTGSDVDILLGSRDDFARFVKKLVATNFTFHRNDLFSATVERRDFEVNIDLQLEVTVSGLPYINKKILMQNVYEVRLDEGFARTLNQPADTLVVACHAFYKEHIFTLADFYTCALSITKENSETLCELAIEAKSVAALSAMLAWTKRVATEAFGLSLPGVDAALNILGNSTLANMLNSRNIHFPMRLPKVFSFLSLAEKICKDDYARSGWVQAVSSSLIRKKTGILVDHFRRESY